MVEILTDNALGKTRHGFFTRKGGKSSGVFEGLNCGTGSSDDAAIVADNRAVVAESFDVLPEYLLSLHQIHSPDVVSVTEPWKNERPKADALVTDRPGLALGVLTADCAPVLFSDGKVIGAAHAGWKGALYGVLSNTIDAMCALGARRDQITAVVGPCISQRNYEVGQEFFENFYDLDPDYSRFFVNGATDKYHFDLPGFVLQQLRDQGVSAGWIGHCTYADPARFYSYRRSTHQNDPDSGRQISVIRL